VVINTLAVLDGATHPDPIVEGLYLMVASSLMTVPVLQIDRGRLTLSAIVSGAAAILLNPLDAGIVGLVGPLVQARHRPSTSLFNGLMNGTSATVGSVVAAQLRIG